MGKQRNPKKMHFHSDLEKVLFSANDIATRVAEIGQQLATDCRDERPLLLAALSGASIFLSDLARAITPVPEGLHLDFVRASSYHGTSTSTSGNVEIAATQKIPVKGRHVLLVEDIGHRQNSFEVEGALAESGRKFRPACDSPRQGSTTDMRHPA